MEQTVAHFMVIFRDKLYFVDSSLSADIYGAVFVLSGVPALPSDEREGRGCGQIFRLAEEHRPR